MNIPSFFQALIYSALIASPITAYAETASENKISTTISYQQHQALTDAQKKNMLKETEETVISLTLHNLFNVESQIQARHSPSNDYSLYDASTILIIDNDLDGFYQRFSVTIDADTLFHHSTIYADFYLSYEGGPWIYYASSHNYDIHSDSVDDKFTVETVLADGYPTGYYDMRIKLYDAVSDEYLLTYDYLNDSSLNAIPLEDSHKDSDEYYSSSIETEVIITHGAGSINILGLFILLLALLQRQRMTLSPKNKACYISCN